LNERQLKLTINQHPGANEMIFADGERIFQAIRNVISNAIKYTPNGGEIIIDGRLLPGFLETTISDTGIGIEPDDHIKIFEKFGRLGSASLHSSGKTKYKGGGPGLGLPITKGIVEAHGGSIWVESEN
jgi:signal transduction histidine kinase